MRISRSILELVVKCPECGVTHYKDIEPCGCPDPDIDGRELAEVLASEVNDDEADA